MNLVIFPPKNAFRLGYCGPRRIGEVIPLSFHLRRHSQSCSWGITLRSFNVENCCPRQSGEATPLMIKSVTVTQLANPPRQPTLIPQEKLDEKDRRTVPFAPSNRSPDEGVQTQSRIKTSAPFGNYQKVGVKQIVPEVGYKVRQSEKDLWNIPWPKCKGVQVIPIQETRHSIWRWTKTSMHV